MLLFSEVFCSAQWAAGSDESSDSGGWAAVKTAEPVFAINPSAFALDLLADTVYLPLATAPTFQ